MPTKIFLAVLVAMLAIAAIIGITAPIADNAAARATALIAPVDDAWRAALPRDPTAATAAYMTRLTPATRARSDAYFEGGYWLTLWNFVAMVGACWLILSSRVLKRIGTTLEATRLRHISGLLVAMAFVLLTWLLTAPLAVFQGFYREHAYGLANQSFTAWLGEQAIGIALSTLVGGLFLAGIWRVVRTAPRTWWIWGTGLALIFLVVGIMLGPVYIDPLFNTYKPLSDGPVKQAILSMARASGVPADNVYQMDSSKQSNRISANVSGIFGTAAVRLNDNLLRRTSLPEIKGVVGHELGHYVLNHIYKMLLAFGLIIAIGFAFLNWSLRAAVRRFGPRYGITELADSAALPLFVVLFSAYFFVMTPISNTQIRVDETEADIFGLNAAAEPNGFAEVDLKLTEYRKADPSDLEEFLFFDHPSPRKRIYSAMRWRAEHLPPTTQ